MGVFYLPHCKGLKENELGGYSYDIEDLNDDGEIDFSDGGDRYIAGQATPKVTIGSNISFRYKSFDIAMQIMVLSVIRYSMARAWLIPICLYSLTTMY